MGMVVMDRSNGWTPTKPNTFLSKNRFFSSLSLAEVEGVSSVNWERETK